MPGVQEKREMGGLIMEDCDVCFKIICKNCQWTASPRDVLLIQTRRLKECPECGWMPGDTVENEAEIII